MQVMRTRIIIAITVILALTAMAYDARTRSLPLGVHTLHPDDSELQLIRDLDARYLIQVFPWRQIEPSPGEYH